MDINSRAGWKKEFSVAAPLLCAKAALSEGTFKRARKALQEKGYIHVASQGANRAAAYQMISLVNDVEAANSASGGEADPGMVSGSVDLNHD